MLPSAYCRALGTAALICTLLARAAPADSPPQQSPKLPEAAAGIAGKPAKPPAPAAAVEPPAAEAPQPQAPPGAVGELQPVLHAQQARITTCMDTIVGESAAVIDSAHTAISSWATEAPDQNGFLSIIGLSYANKTAPNAAAVMFAAPLAPDKCGGATVQVYPVGQSCSALQAALIKQGRTVAMLRALPVVETKTGYRDVLIPTAGGGCVLIAVGLRQ